MHGHAPVVPFRQRFAPIGFFRRQLQDARVTRMIRQQVETELHLIGTNFSDDLIQEHFGRIGSVGRPHRPPPEHRNPHIRGGQSNAEIRDGIWQGGRALNRGGIDAILDQPGEGTACNNRLADNMIVPGDQLAVRVETGPHPVDIGRAISSASRVVLAGPLHFHRCLPANRLADSDRFQDHIRIRRCPPAKPAAGLHDVHAHF